MIAPLWGREGSVQAKRAQPEESPKTAKVTFQLYPEGTTWEFPYEEGVPISRYIKRIGGMTGKRRAFDADNETGKCRPWYVPQPGGKIILIRPGVSLYGHLQRSRHDAGRLIDSSEATEVKLY